MTFNSSTRSPGATRLVSYERISIVTRMYMYPKRSLDCAYMYMYMTQKFFMYPIEGDKATELLNNTMEV